MCFRLQAQRQVFIWPPWHERLFRKRASEHYLWGVRCCRTRLIIRLSYLSLKIDKTFLQMDFWEFPFRQQETFWPPRWCSFFTPWRATVVGRTSWLSWSTCWTQRTEILLWTEKHFTQPWGSGSLSAARTGEPSQLHVANTCIMYVRTSSSDDFCPKTINISQIIRGIHLKNSRQWKFKSSEIFPMLGLGDWEDCFLCRLFDDGYQGSGSDSCRAPGNGESCNRMLSKLFRIIFKPPF